MLQGGSLPPKKAQISIGLDDLLALTVRAMGAGWTPRRDSLTFSYIRVDLLA